MALGVKTTAEDVRSLVRYLAEHPTGVDLPSLKADTTRLADARKLAAFGAWGIVTRQEGKLRLTPLGRDLAQQPDDDAQGFMAIISEIPPYERALAWAQERGMAQITANEVASYWFDHHPDAVGSGGDETLRDQAVAFFSLAEAAGLGRLVVGRSGKPTRLELEDENAALPEPTPSAAAPPVQAEDAHDPSWSEPEEEAVPVPLKEDEPRPRQTEGRSADAKVFFVDTAGNDELKSQLETVLRFGGLEVRPLAGDWLAQMRGCGGGVVAVDPEDMDGTRWLLLGAAAALFGRGLVLLVPPGTQLPPAITNIPVVEVQGGSLGWNSGLELMRYLSPSN